MVTCSPKPHFCILKRFPVALSSEATNKVLLLTSVLKGVYPFDFHFAHAISLEVSKSWCDSSTTPIRKKQYGHSSRLGGSVFPPQLNDLFIYF